jgi:protein-S-isoprenylcysteine O-methyltransferase Ste14
MQGIGHIVNVGPAIPASRAGELVDTLLQWAGRGIAVCWILWAIVWIAASLGTKPAVRRERGRSRASYLLALAASVILLLIGRATHPGAALIAAGPPTSWLYVRFIRLYPGVVRIGAPLVLAGILTAFWARFHLGGNWSGEVTVKQDHVLVRTGPYRYVRHPIYTGLLMAVAGTACAIGQLRGVLAFVLTFWALWYKSRIEERLMTETFGDAYRAYQAQVKGLIPFVF